ASRRLATQLGDDIAKPVANNIFNQQASNTISSINNSEEQQEVLDRPNNQARSKGEPHLTTFDGVGYSFQGAGEFTLVESLDGDLNIQVRYVQIDNNVTVASAVATEVDGFNVVIDSEGIEFVEDPNNPGNQIPQVSRSSGRGEALVTIDGQAVEIPGGGSIDVGDSRIFRSSGEEYTIVYAGENGILEDGDDQLVVNYLRPGTINIVDVYLGDEQQGNITGLLGNLNGNPDDDIALRDGTVLPRPLEFDFLYGDYRDDYRITTIEESLFTYEPGQSPDTFFNPNFPEIPLTYDTLSPELRAKGDAAALEAGYEPGTFEFESVAFDFAVTCDPAFLEGRETDPEAIGVDIVDNDDGGIIGNGTAVISGIKFNDLNGNGVRDSELVQGANPDVIFTIDVSGSTETGEFQGTIDIEDLNNDGDDNDIIDAEIAGFIALNQQLIEQGLGDTANVGIVSFSSFADQLDLDPATDGIQITTTPNADNNNNGILDVNEVLQSLQGGGGTNFRNALNTSEQSFIELETQPGNGNLIFLSDGQGSRNLDEVLERLNSLDINISAFGVGEGASIDNLRNIDPDAEVFTSTDGLLASFGGIDANGDGVESESSIEPGLEGITIYLDLNDNGLLDDNEPFEVTDENGEYVFEGLAAGSYIVREILPDGFIQTTPVDGQFTINLEEGDVFDEANFGNTGDTLLLNAEFADV
ncbi:MAG: VWD domain-containing protein, partial [Cyanobacteria bacterium J06638_38]